MTLLEKALELENSELAGRVAELGMEAQKLPRNPQAFAAWQKAQPELAAKWQALADEFGTTVKAIDKMLDKYYEEND